MSIIVAGAPGAGKTTVLNEAKKIDKKIRIHGAWEYILDEAKKQKIKTSHDTIRKLPRETWIQLQERAFEEIKHKSEMPLIDTHLAILSENGYFPGLPENVLKIIQPKLIILLEADPKDILARRKKDKTRQRSDFGGSTKILEQQDINRAYAATCSNKTNALVKIIVNREGKAKEAAKELIETIKSVKNT